MAAARTDALATAAAELRAAAAAVPLLPRDPPAPPPASLLDLEGRVRGLARSLVADSSPEELVKAEATLIEQGYTLWNAGVQRHNAAGAQGGGAVEAVLKSAACDLLGASAACSADPSRHATAAFALLEVGQLWLKLGDAARANAALSAAARFAPALERVAAGGPDRPPPAFVLPSCFLTEGRGGDAARAQCAAALVEMDVARTAACAQLGDVATCEDAARRLASRLADGGGGGGAGLPPAAAVQHCLSACSALVKAAAAIIASPAPDVQAGGSGAGAGDGNSAGPSSTTTAAAARAAALLEAALRMLDGLEVEETDDGAADVAEAAVRRQHVQVMVAYALACLEAGPSHAQRAAGCMDVLRRLPPGVGPRGAAASYLSLRLLLLQGRLPEAQTELLALLGDCSPTPAPSPTTTAATPTPCPLPIAATNAAAAAAAAAAAPAGGGPAVGDGAAADVVDGGNGNAGEAAGGASRRTASTSSDHFYVVDGLARVLAAMRAVGGGSGGGSKGSGVRATARSAGTSGDTGGAAAMEMEGPASGPAAAAVGDALGGSGAGSSSSLESLRPALQLLAGRCSQEGGAGVGACSGGAAAAAAMLRDAIALLIGDDTHARGSEGALAEQLALELVAGAVAPSPTTANATATATATATSNNNIGVGERAAALEGVARLLWRRAAHCFNALKKVGRAEALCTALLPLLDALQHAQQAQQQQAHGQGQQQQQQEHGDGSMQQGQDVGGQQGQALDVGSLRREVSLTLGLCAMKARRFESALEHLQSARPVQGQGQGHCQGGPTPHPHAGHPHAHLEVAVAKVLLALGRAGDAAAVIGSLPRCGGFEPGLLAACCMEAQQAGHPAVARAALLALHAHIAAADANAANTPSGPATAPRAGASAAAAAGGGAASTADDVEMADAAIAAGAGAAGGAGGAADAPAAGVAADLGAGQETGGFSEACVLQNLIRLAVGPKGAPQPGVSLGEAARYLGLAAARLEDVGFTTFFGCGSTDNAEAEVEASAAAAKQLEWLATTAANAAWWAASHPQQQHGAAQQDLQAQHGAAQQGQRRLTAELYAVAGRLLDRHPAPSAAALRDAKASYFSAAVAAVDEAKAAAAASAGGAAPAAAAPTTPPPGAGAPAPGQQQQQQQGVDAEGSGGGDQVVAGGSHGGRGSGSDGGIGGSGGSGDGCGNSSSSSSGSRGESECAIAFAGRMLASFKRHLGDGARDEYTQEAALLEFELAALRHDAAALAAALATLRALPHAAPSRLLACADTAACARAAAAAACAANPMACVPGTPTAAAGAVQATGGLPPQPNGDVGTAVAAEAAATAAAAAFVEAAEAAEADALEAALEAVLARGHAQGNGDGGQGCVVSWAVVGQLLHRLSEAPSRSDGDRLRTYRQAADLAAAAAVAAAVASAPASASAAAEGSGGGGSGDAAGSAFPQQHLHAMAILCWNHGSSLARRGRYAPGADFMAAGLALATRISGPPWAEERLKGMEAAVGAARRAAGAAATGVAP